MSFKKKATSNTGATGTTGTTAAKTGTGLDKESYKQIEQLFLVHTEDTKKILKDGLSPIARSVSDHECRIKVLEEAVGIILNPATPTQSTTPATAAVPTTTQPQSATTTPPTPPQQTTQPTPPQQTATTQASSQTTASNQTSSPTNIVSCRNGVGMAYCYWDYETQAWVMLSDIWAAKQLSNGTYTPVWVWYENGKIHHKLDPNEVKKYLP